MLLFLRVTLMWDFLWHPVQVRTDSVVFNLMDDGEYWNHRPFFYDVSFPFCILCRCCWLLFTTMYADRAVVLQYADFHRMRLIWLCGNPVMVTVSMWLSQRDHFQHVKDQLDFGFTRISLLHKLSRYSKDYTKFKFPCSFLCSMGAHVWYLEIKKTSEWGWLWFQYMQSIIFVYVGYAHTCICDYKVGKSSGMAWVDHCLLPELWIPLGLVT